ncbi:MAG: zeta toxin family protein [Candidatus Adiutrix sp.]|jgi:predicted ABC-type ATPase|nr:zeta toxin family protein [Candidatus Adiutrix sp.]
MGKDPHVIILAGPNGAGKSTSAPMLLRDTFAVDEFVNADTIAQGLSAFRPESAALEAGRIMLVRLHDLANKRGDFAFETTLASRTFAPWLKRLGKEGYKIHLMFLTLPDADAAIARVASRVSLGGHSVPINDIKRRFTSGLENFFQLYLPIVSSWKIYDNSRPGRPVKFAEGGPGLVSKIIDITLYDKLIRRYGHV